jgi:large subunit ribosomal protein L3
MAKITVERIKTTGDVKQPFQAYPEEMTLEVGKLLTVEQVFKDVLAVDVIGTSKGRGTQGVMKRHNFSGLPAAHGAKKVHRQAGSTASLASNRGSGRPKKGLKRAGRYGNERITIRNLKVVKIDVENNLLLIRGGIPGFPGALVMVRPTNKVGPGSPKAKTKKIEVIAKKK